MKQARAAPLGAADSAGRVRALLDAAIGIANRGDLPRAIARIDAALALDDASPRAWYWRARLHFDLREYDEALADAARLVALRPADPYGHLLRCLANYGARDYPACVADCTAAINTAPEGESAVAALSERGLCRHRLGVIDAALADYDAALAPAAPALSVEQARLVEEFGFPETFMLSLYAAPDGSGPNRAETWFYHDLQTWFGFLNGRFVASGSLDEHFPDASFAPYRPTALTHGMSAAAVQAALGARTLIRLPVSALDGSMQCVQGAQGLELYFADRLLIGFADDELVLVQSFPGIGAAPPPGGRR